MEGFDGIYGNFLGVAPHQRTVSAQHKAGNLAQFDFEPELVGQSNTWDNHWQPSSQPASDYSSYDPARAFSPASSSAPSPFVQQSPFMHQTTAFNQGLGFGEIELSQHRQHTQAYSSEEQDSLAELDEGAMTKRDRRLSRQAQPYPATPASPSKRQGHASKLSLSAIASPFGDLALSSSASTPSSPHPLTPLTPSSVAGFNEDFVFGSSSSGDSGNEAVSGLGASIAANGRSVFGGRDSLTAPGTPSRSSPSKRAAHQKHAKQRSSASPTKGSISVGRTIGRRLTDDDRRQILLYMATYPHKKQEEIGAFFGVERSTISKQLKLKDSLFPGVGEFQDALNVFKSKEFVGSPSPSPSSAFDAPTPGSSSMLHSLSSSSDRSAAKVRFPRVEEELRIWAIIQQELGVTVKDSDLGAQARQIASEIAYDDAAYGKFKGSQSWLDGFKSRAGLSFVRANSPAASLGLPDLPVEDCSSPAESLFAAQPSKRQNALFASNVIAATPIKGAAGSGDSESTPTGSRATSSSTLTEQYNNDAFAAGQALSRPGSAFGIQPQLMRGSTSSSSLYEDEGAQPFEPASYYPGSGYSQQSVAAYDYGSPQLEQSPFLANATTFSRPYNTYHPQPVHPQQQQRQYAAPSPQPTQQHRAPSTGHRSGQTSPVEATFAGSSHTRTGSFASTASNFSGMTAFSSSATDTPSTGPLHGAFPTTSSNGGSPSIAHQQHYFNHGDGTQSQLQAAFGPRSQSCSPPDHLGRAVLPSTRSAAAQPQLRQAASAGAGTQLAEAFSSLRIAVDFLRSAEGQGLCLPKDLIMFEDISSKMNARIAEQHAALAGQQHRGHRHSGSPHSQRSVR